MDARYQIGPGAIQRFFLSDCLNVAKVKILGNGENGHFSLSKSRLQSFSMSRLPAENEYVG